MRWVWWRRRSQRDDEYGAVTDIMDVALNEFLDRAGVPTSE